MIKFLMDYALVLGPLAMAAGVGMWVHAGRVLRQMEGEDRG